MDPLQDNNPLSDDRACTDRPGCPSLKADLLTRIMRSRWIASFIVAFAVSWSFHQADEIGQHRIERQQRVLACTVTGVANAQAKTKPGERVVVRPILLKCEKQAGK
jgi:hypothetical protein